MFDVTEVFLFEEDGQAVAAESQDGDDDQRLSHAWELSLQSAPEGFECSLFFLSLLHVKNGSTLNALSSSDVLIVEETWTDVVMEVGSPVNSPYRHWNALWYTVPLGMMYNSVILIKLCVSLITTQKTRSV